MRCNVLVTAFMLLVCGMAFYRSPVKSQSVASDEAGPSNECRLAVELAEAFLPKVEVKASDVKLIEARNLLISGPDCCDPRLWRLTFLTKRLIDEKGLRGKGGQIYLEVDVRTKEVKLRGRGE